MPPVMPRTQNLNVLSTRPLIVPRVLEEQIPASAASLETVVAGRAAVQRILDGEEDRLLVIVGPCSIHDVGAAYEYARRLAQLREALHGQMEVIMRVYFEKPRTTLGWKGLINDPHLDGSFDMEEGLRLARRLLVQINELGLPTATEMLDPITPQYIDDQVTWAAIGARTTESQTHRQMASGLSMPVGFKNSTEGNLQVALDAMQSALHSHRFLGMDDDGRTCLVTTRGNRYGHLILRGGRSGTRGRQTNYRRPQVQAAATLLRGAGLSPRMIIDCSHANSNKIPERQPAVLRAVVRQIREDRAAGCASALVGVMLESHLHSGQQALEADLSRLAYGVSVTDGCLGWDATQKALEKAARDLKA